MKKIRLLVFFVLLGTSQNVEAQWELVEQVDKWGEKNGQRNAVSEVTQSSTNQGYRLFLKVIGGRNECFFGG